MKQFNVDDLLKIAQTQTGLSDFGPSDFMEGFTVLVKSINEQSDLNERGWNQLEETFLRLLTNRLHFAQDLANYPEIADEELLDPLIIISPPRTGTTKMHQLLATSNDFQTLPMWKGHMFARIPGLEDGGTGQRIQETADYVRRRYEVSPDIIFGHPMFPEQPEEESLLSECTFRHRAFTGFNGLRYASWLMFADMQPTYDYLFSQLQYLQWQDRSATNKPWLLKSPYHMGLEKHLTKIFTNPRFIVTHRDPAVFVPSLFSMAGAGKKLFYDEQLVTSSLSSMSGPVNYLSFIIREQIKWRESNPNVKVLDLSYKEIDKDAMTAIGKVYDFLGASLSDDAKENMNTWIQNNQKEKHGRHVYSAEQFGVTQDGIRKRFELYIERYSNFL
jgi:hypothetical protein